MTLCTAPCFRASPRSSKHPTITAPGRAVGRRRRAANPTGTDWHPAAARDRSRASRPAPVGTVACRKRHRSRGTSPRRNTSDLYRLKNGKPSPRTCSTSSPASVEHGAESRRVVVPAVADVAVERGARPSGHGHDEESARARRIAQRPRAGRPDRRRVRSPRCTPRRRPIRPGRSAPVGAVGEVELRTKRGIAAPWRCARRTPSALSSIPTSSASGHACRRATRRSPWPLPMSRTRSGAPRRPTRSRMSRRRYSCAGFSLHEVGVPTPVRLPVVDRPSSARRFGHDEVPALRG